MKVETLRHNGKYQQWSAPTGGELIRRVQVVRDHGGAEVLVRALHGPLKGLEYSIPREHIRDRP